jgi:hypothetical protein
MFRSTALAGSLAALVTFVSTAVAQESFTNQELSDLIAERGKPYVISKLRNKTVSVSGELEEFVDTGIGSAVWATMDIPNGHYAVICKFPRSDTATYDRMAQVSKGSPVTFTGKFKDIDEAFISVSLNPCMPQ